MPKPICVGQVGVHFDVEILDDGEAVDIAAATVLQVKFCKPDGTDVVQTGVLATDGSDGLIRYTTIEDDLDQAGRWTVRGYVELPTFQGNGTESSFIVNA